jgi:hypothetical protein
MRAGDYGVVFTITLAQGANLATLANATSIQLIAIQPDGTTRKTFTMADSGDHITATYTSQPNDFLEPGYYLLQMVVTYPSEQLGGSIFNFNVGKAL